MLVFPNASSEYQASPYIQGKSLLPSLRQHLLVYKSINLGEVATIADKAWFSLVRECVDASKPRISCINLVSQNVIKVETHEMSSWTSSNQVQLPVKK